MKERIAGLVLAVLQIGSAQSLSAHRVYESAFRDSLPKAVVFVNTSNQRFSIDSLEVEPVPGDTFQYDKSFPGHAISLAFKREMVSLGCTEYRATTSDRNRYPWYKPVCGLELAPGDSVRFSDFDIDACHCALKTGAIVAPGDTVRVHFIIRLRSMPDGALVQSFKVDVIGAYKFVMAIRSGPDGSQADRSWKPEFNALGVRFPERKIEETGRFRAYRLFGNPVR